MMLYCSCGGMTGGQHAVNCPLMPPITITPLGPVYPALDKGWLCPRCGGGVAPHVSRCPCITTTHPLTTLEQMGEATSTGWSPPSDGER